MTSSEITIEPATAEDHPRLRVIQRDVLAEPTPDLLAAAVDGTAAASPSTGTRNATDADIVDGAGLALVAQVDRPARSDDPVGYVLVLTAGDVAYVPELAVASAWQRQGVGTELIEGACERATADGATEIRLTVRAADGGARAFYRERGFELLEELPDHYEAGAGTGLLLGRPL
ncbi:GNAT family N-acetyltransferase [Halorhabdus amylolytica]|uniref:GNAT family N-acetyltransferase n=1 Tax=Halorhabdus amylolytica TaxID=2559573 RepID=UPI0010AA0D7E|nr:N-acetyltransferase [Halorhabdus amylolytica]